MHHIAAKEMVPDVITIAVWNPSWRSTAVKVFSDNVTVVSALSSGSACDPLLIHPLLPTLLLCILLHGVTILSHGWHAQHCSRCTVERHVRLYCFSVPLAPGILQAYGSGHHRYLTLCTQAGFSPLLLTEHKLCMSLAHLASQGLSNQIIKSYYIRAGLGDPFAGDSFPLLQHILPAIKHLPITPAIIRILQD